LQRAATTPNGAAIYVDYAHTPDALANALRALRAHMTPEGRLHLVFGCGGDRDAGKRPLMGEIAANLADGVVVTDDNPRHEDAASIRAAILAACPEAQEIAARGEAIAYALTQAEADDFVLVAGKGHETGQIIGDTILPFSDVMQVTQLVENMSGRSMKAGRA
jgi:UDP-N-acetylmuramoyl-L-alanyl-D-glutamate--2,6-diaminopimelate ligase